MLLIHFGYLTWMKQLQQLHRVLDTYNFVKQYYDQSWSFWRACWRLFKVGLYLPRPVFTHGQLYVVVSRVKSKQCLKVVVCDQDANVSKTTTKVVYKEVLEGLWLKLKKVCKIHKSLYIYHILNCSILSVTTCIYSHPIRTIRCACHGHWVSNR